MISKEEGNDDEASNEEGIKSMSFEKDWDPFLEDFLPKTVSRLTWLCRCDYFLNAEMLVGADEIIDGSLQGDRNLEEAR